MSAKAEYAVQTCPARHGRQWHRGQDRRSGCGPKAYAVSRRYPGNLRTQPPGANTAVARVDIIGASGHRRSASPTYLRCIDGPLADTIRDIWTWRPAARPPLPLTDVWRAARQYAVGAGRRPRWLTLPVALPAHRLRRPDYRAGGTRRTAPRAMVTSRQSHRQGCLSRRCNRRVNGW